MHVCYPTKNHFKKTLFVILKQQNIHNLIFFALFYLFVSDNLLTLQIDINFMTAKLIRYQIVH